MENRDVNMGKVIQKNSYDDIWKTFGNKAFYIFGNTDIANLNDKREKYMIHDLPIKDVNWLKQAVSNRISREVQQVL